MKVIINARNADHICVAVNYWSTDDSRRTDVSKTKRATRYDRSEQGASPVTGKKVRYAVVGLGYISQVAVLPASNTPGRTRNW